MPLSPAEAQTALRDLSVAESASAKLYGYRHASPHLIVWGMIWIVGYGLTYAKPQWAAVWPVLVLGGTIASFWIGWTSKPAGARDYDWRYLATALAVFAYIAALFVIMPPRNSMQISAFFPILVALFYSLIGIWTRGARMLIAGIVVAALTLGGYFLLPQYFLLWMAVVGGGAVMLGGFWLRSV
jgi:hypothetical protein